LAEGATKAEERYLRLAGEVLKLKRAELIAFEGEPAGDRAVDPLGFDRYQLAAAQEIEGAFVEVGGGDLFSHGRSFPEEKPSLQWEGISGILLPAKRFLLFVMGLCFPKAAKLGGSRAFFVLSTRGARAPPERRIFQNHVKTLLGVLHRSYFSV
jgi:hypothetical protein